MSTSHGETERPLVVEAKSRWDDFLHMLEVSIAVGALWFTTCEARRQERINERQIARTDEGAAYDAYFSYQAAVSEGKYDADRLKHRGLVIAERIYGLRASDGAWHNTVKNMVCEVGAKTG